MRRLHPLVLIATSAAIAAGLAGCAGRAENPPAPTPTPVTAETPSVSATASSQPATASAAATSAPTATTLTEAPAAATAPVSASSKRYAKELGGVSHKGEVLYFIIGGNFASEAAATKALKKARPYFGDMQDYFIVQRSDNFEGLRPGWWILIESYRSIDSAKSQMEFTQRAFTEAYIKQATVKTSDPIPVYNDLVDGAAP